MESLFFCLALMIILMLICFVPKLINHTKEKDQEKTLPVSQKENQEDTSSAVTETPSVSSLNYKVYHVENSRKENWFIMREIFEYDINHNRLEDYIVLDLETTGLSSQFDRIVEIGAIKISHGEIVDEFSTLVNPERHISEGASSVNGIYDEDVKDAPKYEDIVNQLADFLIGQTILGYNVSFDLAFINQMFKAFGIAGNIEYFDVLRYAKHTLNGLPNYKLNTVASYINAPVMPEHRATEDAKATNYIFQYCRDFLIQQQIEKKEKRKRERKLEKQLRQEAYHLSPLYNVKFCFTGLFSIERSQIEDMAKNVGGLIRGEVNSVTDYLVAGDISPLPEWAVERKFRKAQKLQAEGKKVKIIDEKEFTTLINQAKKILDEANPEKQENNV